MPADPAQLALRSVLWLASENDVEQRAADRLGMLLRRVRHERDIPTRETNTAHLRGVLRIISQIRLSPKLEDLTPAGLLSDDLAAFFAWTRAPLERPAGTEFSATWSRLVAYAHDNCDRVYQCDGSRCLLKEKLGEKPWPCLRDLRVIEEMEGSPEALIYRLNRPSQNPPYTLLGDLLRSFSSESLLNRVVAAYFTYYFPRNVFRKCDMGWVAMRTSELSLLGDSWNFIHWCSGDEMEKFYSPSRIIRNLDPDDASLRLVDCYWVLARSLIPECLKTLESPRTRARWGLAEEQQSAYSQWQHEVARCAQELPAAHPLARGVVCFTDLSGASGQVAVHIPRTGNPEHATVVALHELPGLQAGTETDEPVAVYDMLGSFLNRIFTNRWSCGAYVRFPILPQPQLRRGADIFIAFDTDDPRVIVEGMAQLSEPLRICAALIGEDTSVSTAQQLERGVGHDLARFLKHEVGAKTDELRVCVDAVEGGQRGDVIQALKGCATLSEVLHVQLDTATFLNTSEDHLLDFSAVRERSEAYSEVLRRVQGAEGFQVTPQFSGFKDTDRIDQRIVFICNLMLHNAAKHSGFDADGRPPGARLHVTHLGGPRSRRIRITVSSWYSENSEKDVQRAFALARPDEPSQSKDALYAAARDLNGDRYGMCYTIKGQRLKGKPEDVGRWEITVTYDGRYRR